MVNIDNHQGNVSQNHNEISSHTCQNGISSKRTQISMRMWSKENLVKNLLVKIVNLVAQLVKNLLAMRETWVQSLGWEDPLEKGKAIHSTILA